MILTFAGTPDIVRVISSASGDIEVSADWVDWTPTTFTPGHTNTLITTATTTTIVAGPASDQREVKAILIANRHASTSMGIIVEHYDGTTPVNVWAGTLLAGESVWYDGKRWYPYSASGLPKTLETRDTGELANTSVAQQTGFASDTYLIGSAIPVPINLQAKSMYKCQFNVVKTAAGTATPIINIRFGTAGTTGDTSRGTLTFSAQTAAVDEGVFEIDCIFRVVGASGVLQSLAQLFHRLSITGLGTGVSEPEIATSAAFNTAVAASIIGVSVNGGTSAAWTVETVRAQLINLA
jgi:hypothetical protein